MALKVTEQASTLLKEMLDAVEHLPEQVIRMVPGSAGDFKLVLDTPQKGDQEVQHQGNTVLVIEANFSESLSGTALETREEPNGSSLIVTRTKVG
jgi:hypothetical protein